MDNSQLKWYFNVPIIIVKTGCHAHGHANQQPHTLLEHLGQASSRCGSHHRLIHLQWWRPTCRGHHRSFVKRINERRKVTKWYTGGDTTHHLTLESIKSRLHYWSLRLSLDTGAKWPVESVVHGLKRRSRGNGMAPKVGANDEKTRHSHKRCRNDTPNMRQRRYLYQFWPPADFGEQWEGFTFVNVVPSKSIIATIFLS